MGEIREALSAAHHVAAIQPQVTDERRARLPADAARNLNTITALSHYLESRNTDSRRREKLISYARGLLDEDPTEQKLEQAPHPEITHEP